MLLALKLGPGPQKVHLFMDFGIDFGDPTHIQPIFYHRFLRSNHTQPILILALGAHSFKKQLRPAVQVSLKPLESTSRQIRLQLGSWLQ